MEGQRVFPEDLCHEQGSERQDEPVRVHRQSRQEFAGAGIGKYCPGGKQGKEKQRAWRNGDPVLAGQNDEVSRQRKKQRGSQAIEQRSRMAGPGKPEQGKQAKDDECLPAGRPVDRFHGFRERGVCLAITSQGRAASVRGRIGKRDASGNFSFSARNPAESLPATPSACRFAAFGWKTTRPPLF